MCLNVFGGQARAGGRCGRVRLVAMLLISFVAPAFAGCWRDGILAAVHRARGSTTPASAAGAGSSSSSTSCCSNPSASGSTGGAGLYQVQRSQQVYASNYVPLWCGLTQGDEKLGARVVASLEASGLVQPGGRCACGGSNCSVVDTACVSQPLIGLKRQVPASPWVTSGANMQSSQVQSGGRFEAQKATGGCVACSNEARSSQVLGIAWLQHIVLVHPHSSHAGHVHGRA